MASAQKEFDAAKDAGEQLQQWFSSVSATIKKGSNLEPNEVAVFLGTHGILLEHVMLHGPQFASTGEHKWSWKLSNILALTTTFLVRFPSCKVMFVL